MRDINPCLWFPQKAKEAAALYLEVFPDAELLEGTTERTEAELVAPSFSVLRLRLAGTELLLFDAEPLFEFTEAISLFVPCDDQEEVDRIWFGLTAKGGQEDRCGWLKDPFGVSWQIVPVRLGELLGDPDPERAAAAHAAMMQMSRIVVAELEAAADAAG